MMTEDADRLAVATACACERGHEAGKHRLFTREGAAALPVDQVDMRIDLQQAANIFHLLRANFLHRMADGKEDRRLGQAVHRHMQETGKVGERAAHAEGERNETHVLDRGVREQALYVAPPIEHEAREYERQEPQGDHQWTGSNRSLVRREEHLEAQHGIQRDVEEKSRKDRRNRGRALRVGIGQLPAGTRFSQIAAWTDEDIQSIDQLLNLKGRADRDAWVAQAKRFASAASASNVSGWA